MGWKAPNSALTAERAREVFDYDPITGALYWRIRMNNRRAGSSVGGRPTSAGYLTVGVDGIRYTQSRVIWLWMTGEWPRNEVDHRNRIKSDNWWLNLRDATRLENVRNIAQARRDSSSGVRGIYLVRGRRWRASIRTGGRSVHLGYFSTKEAAESAYITARALHFGEFSPS